MKVAGIDPDSRGGVAIANADLQLLDAIPIPESMLELVKYLRKRCVGMVAVEQQQAFPKEGVVSCFNNGHQYARVKTALEMGGIHYVVVHPKRWQSQSRDLPGATAKERARAAVELYFPEWEFRQPTPRRQGLSKHPHQGMVDAAMIARWAAAEGYCYMEQDLSFDPSETAGVA